MAYRRCHERTCAGRSARRTRAGHETEAVCAAVAGLRAAAPGLAVQRRNRRLTAEGRRCAAGPITRCRGRVLSDFLRKFSLSFFDLNLQCRGPTVRKVRPSSTAVRVRERRAYGPRAAPSAEGAPPPRTGDAGRHRTLPVAGSPAVTDCRTGATVRRARHSGLRRLPCGVPVPASCSCSLQVIRFASAAEAVSAPPHTARTLRGHCEDPQPRPVHTAPFTPYRSRPRSPCARAPFAPSRLRLTFAFSMLAPTSTSSRARPSSRASCRQSGRLG